MKRKTLRQRSVGLLLAVLMLLTLLPGAALAADDVTVYVSVENKTFFTDAGSGAPAWTGTLLAPYAVKVPAGSTIMDATVKAFEEKGITQQGAESNYISDINGLAAFAGGMESGWMITVNDWFINAGAGAFTAEEGDVICWMYTSNGYGADLGGSWENNDTTLKALEFSTGVLTPEFDPAVLSYKLTVPTGTSGVFVTPTASNKNFQVRANVGGTEYKRMQQIPVRSGTVIKVGCGDPSWPTMNPDPVLTEYTITVKIPVKADVFFSYQADGSYVMPKQKAAVLSNLSDIYGYEDDDSGVSAIDVLIKAHQIYYTAENDEYNETEFAAWLAEAFTASGSMISKWFDITSYSAAQLVNGSAPGEGELLYSAFEMIVTDGDYVEFLLYQDAYWMDYYTWFEDSDGNTRDALTVRPGEDITLYLKGDMLVNTMYGPGYELDGDAMYDMVYGEDLTIVTLDPATGAVAKEFTAEVDDTDGAFTIKFDQPGTYILSAQGDQDEEVYIFSPWLEVTVTTPPVTLPDLDDIEWANFRGNP